MDWSVEEGSGTLDVVTRLPRLLGLSAFVAVSSCADVEGDLELEPLDIPNRCNPIAAEWDCLLPWPSDVFLADDPALPSGFRVQHPAAALPQARNEDGVNFLSVHPADGFSIHPQILALFPGGVDDSNLVQLTDDLEQSRDPEVSPSLLIDLETGEPVLHLAELDPRAERDDGRVLIVRSLVRLKTQHRYAVAFAGLRDKSGDLVRPPEGFRRLRDRQTEVDPELRALAPEYDDEIFPALQALGWEPKAVQLAWTFTTGSEDNLTRDMLAVRDEGLASMQAAPPAVTIVRVEEPADEPDLFRRIHGEIEVPLFVDKDAPGSMLYRNAQGDVIQNGVARVPFLAIIPASVAAAAAPARVVQYGHGFFGERAEIDGEFVRSFAQTTGTVVVAVDWWGLSAADQVFVVADLVERPDSMLRFTDRIHQGMVNQIALSLAVRSEFAEQEAFRFNDTALVDPQSLYFYGISAGHLLGGTLAALNPELDRVALSVGGAALAAVMMRSVPFKQFLGFVEELLPDPMEQQKYIAMTQLTLDRIDPGTYAPHLLRDTYPGSPETRQVLMHAGLGDTSVPPLATHIHARSLGIPYLEPAVRAIAGMEAAAAPVPSALVEFDFNLPEPLPGTKATPPDEANHVHSTVRELAASVAQVDAFFAPDGMVMQACDGTCDPE